MNAIQKESLFIKAYQKTLHLKGSTANMAAANERRALLACWVHWHDTQDKHIDAPAWVRETVINSVAALASQDLRALLPAIPTAILINSIRVDGTINVPAIARAMASEIAANPTTAVAVAQQAQQAQKEARHEAQKEAKRAALEAKRAAKRAAKSYIDSNTCGLI